MDEKNTVTMDGLSIAQSQYFDTKYVHSISNEYKPAQYVGV